MLEATRLKTILRYAGVVAFVALLLPFVVYAVPQVAGAEHSYVVLSSSMSPTIHAGDVVVVDGVQPEHIEEGDVITFEPPSSHQIDSELVTHRVVDVVRRDGGLFFRTKGDANEEPDQALVPAENVVGVVKFHIPYVGHVIQFAGSDRGILAFVVAPAVLLAVSELYSLWQAATTDEHDGDAAPDD